MFYQQLTGYQSGHHKSISYVALSLLMVGSSGTPLETENITLTFHDQPVQCDCYSERMNRKLVANKEISSSLAGISFLRWKKVTQNNKERHRRGTERETT